jgi:hypothetical protein
MMYLYQADKKLKSSFKLIEKAETESALQKKKEELIASNKNYIITNHEV